MIVKPNLFDAQVCCNPKVMMRPPFITDDAWNAIQGGAGLSEVGSPTGDFGVGSTFRIIKYEYDYDSDGFRCEGTKQWLSIFKMSGGCNNLDAFLKHGAEKSHDYESIPANKILDLPLNRAEAKKLIEKYYIGKKFRVIARSADGCTQYGGRYYLFAIEE